MTLPTRVGGEVPPREGDLVDAYARVHTYLRVSVTERCNYRCIYCMPEAGIPQRARTSLLSFEEITRIVSAFVGMGVRRVRLTGGEPLVRRGLVHLVRMLDGLGLDDLAMTTNGHLLDTWAAPLADAGLRRVNVSCDAITPEVFHRLTRGGDITKVLAGIDAARAAGLTPIKINAVMMGAHNREEVLPLVLAFADHADDTEVRFIEAMPFDGHDATQQYLSGADVRGILGARYTLTPEGRGRGGPADHWRIEETGQRIGFISPMTAHFCEACNRLRLDADGHLRTCLSREGGPSLADLLRGGIDDADLAQTLRTRVWGKVAGHEAHLPDGRRFEGVMTRIGG